MPAITVDDITVLPRIAEPDPTVARQRPVRSITSAPSGLTRRVDRLESDGLLTRVGCPGDRRGAFAKLTPRGLEELRRALPHHAEVLARFVGTRLDDSALRILIGLLGSLAGSPS